MDAPRQAHGAPYSRSLHGAPPPAPERDGLSLQRALSHLAFPPIGVAALAYLRLARHHRVVGLHETRRVYKHALSTGRPTLVCANHLTMVDSVFLHHAFGSLADYTADFRRFSWNVPAVENFSRDWRLRALTYLTKCIPIDRAGEGDHHRSVLGKVTYLMACGDVCTLFPEGGRSRSGRVETNRVTYGVGRVLAALDRPQVVCTYLRGERQRGYSDMPAYADVMHVRACVIEPRTAHSGLRAVRDLARQVITKLRDMEDEYFAATSGALHPPALLGRVDSR